MYDIVHFMDLEEVEMVPSTWIIGKDKCVWPPTKNAKMAIKNCSKPKKDWEKYNVRILTPTSVSYSVACSKLEKARYTSDLNTDVDEDFEKRKTRKTGAPKRFRSSSTSGDDSVELKQKSQKLKNKSSTISVPLPPTSLLEESSSKEKSQEIMLSTPSSPVVISTPPRSSTPVYHGNSSTPVYHGTSSTPVYHGTSSTPIYQGIPTDRTSPNPNGYDQSANRETSIHNLSFQLDVQTSTDKHIEFQAKILWMLESLQKQIKEQKLMLVALLKNNSSTNTTDFAQQSFPKIPVNDDKELDTLESFLSDDNNKENLVTVLGATGGTSVQDVTRRILFRILTSAFAMKFSYTGRKGKKKFSGLKLKEVVAGAVRKHVFSQSATDHEIQLAIGNWLRFAPERAKVKRTSGNVDDNATEEEEN